MYFDLTDTEAKSFLVQSRFTSVEGGTRLIRFTDSSRGHQAALGTFDRRAGIYKSYWLYASEVEEVLDLVAKAGPFGLKVIQEISSRWAICDDWGDLKRAWLLTVPPGNTIDCYCGPAKFQPKTSSLAQAKTGKETKNSYPGGSMQFVLGLSEANRQWIKGPIPTLQISKRKLQPKGGS